MFLIQAVLFWLMPHVSGFSGFTSLAFIVLLCYGAGFGTMPAFAADYFGAENVGSIYGLMLTAWGFAGVLGPTLIARIRQSTGHYNQALHIIAVILIVSDTSDPTAASAEDARSGGTAQSSLMGKG
jgi:OFA family oxalate/formate antiporter-like MFS transporter